jgi:hypothetical protein
MAPRRDGENALMDISFYALIGVIVFQVLVICLISLMGNTPDPSDDESARTFEEHSDDR